jgi:hypothetical protein
MNCVNLDEIYITKFSCAKKRKYIPIKCHPYYISLLNNDKAKYESYIKRSKYQLSKPSSSWEHFIQIYQEISENGLDFSNPDSIIVKYKDGKSVCLHGRHRIAMLYMIYGKDTVLELLDDRVVSIQRQNIVYVLNYLFSLFSK